MLEVCAIIDTSTSGSPWARSNVSCTNQNTSVVLSLNHTKYLLVKNSVLLLPIDDNLCFRIMY